VRTRVQHIQLFEICDFLSTKCSGGRVRKDAFSLSNRAFPTRWTARYSVFKDPHKPSRACYGHSRQKGHPEDSTAPGAYDYCRAHNLRRGGSAVKGRPAESSVAPRGKSLTQVNRTFA
jgi:hypothetical protein